MMGRCNGSGPPGRGVSVLARLPLAVAAVCLQALAASAEFKLRYRGTSGHLIIFVHGLWGDPLETFTAKGKTTAGKQKSWLEMMHEDGTPFGSAPPLSTYSTATLGYPASKSDRYSPADITAKLMHELSVQPELEKHEAIYFVAHSFGGLVVEQLLVNAHLSPGLAAGGADARGVPRRDAVARGAAGRGGKSASGMGQGATGREPGENRWERFPCTGYRRSGAWCARHARRQANRSPSSAPMRRSRRGRSGSGEMVVPSASIDSDCSDFPIPADHIEIVKPTDRDAEIYKWLLRNLAKLNRPPSPAADKEAPKIAKAAPPPAPNSTS